MEIDPETNIGPSNLAQLRETGIGRFDFLPALWEATSALVSSELENRFAGLKRLDESDSIRHNSLVTYLLTTRITEPDIELRTRIVRALANVLTPDEQGHLPPENVILNLCHYLSAMRTRQIFALLQVTDFDPSTEPIVALLLSYCSFAGNHLADILANRHAPLTIRKRAAHFIGRIGFLDGLPYLVRLESRLEAHRDGRNSIIDESDELSLLPVIQNSLSLLQSP